MKQTGVVIVCRQVASEADRDGHCVQAGGQCEAVGTLAGQPLWHVGEWCCASRLAAGLGRWMLPCESIGAQPGYRTLT